LHINKNDNIMKSIRKIIPMLLTGVIIALGFCSCVTQKEVTRRTKAAEQELREKKQQLDALKEDNNSLMKRQSVLQQRINELMNPPKVYGPPPILRR